MTDPTADGGNGTSLGEPQVHVDASPSASGRQPLARSVEVLVVILLSLATVSTAWSAYQATRWSGEQAINSGQANALRTESTKMSDKANSQRLIDVQVFLAWVTAESEGDAKKASFLEARFRKEFLPAFEAWTRSAPEGVIPEGAPLDLPEYKLAAQVESERLAEDAAAHVERSKEANQIGDNFILVTVLFATVLFFAGTVGKIESVRIRRMLLVLAGLVWVAGMTIMLLLPQDVGF